ncbi:ACT domain-containing protein [Bacillus licheniformis]|nr:ACT domain-containing protein [Bacillus licheniformis]
MTNGNKSWTESSLCRNEDADGLFEFFGKPRNTATVCLCGKRRDSFLYDLYVDVPDHPGVISEITAILADEQISITNIRIIETREDINGVLRISFQSDEDRNAPKMHPNPRKYETFMLIEVEHMKEENQFTKGRASYSGR